MKAWSPSTLAQLVLVPALYYGAAKLSLALAVTPEALVWLWLINGVLLRALLHFGWRHYLPFSLLVVVAEISADYPTFSVLEATFFGAINVGEATLAYVLLKRWRFNIALAG